MYLKRREVLALAGAGAACALAAGAPALRAADAEPPLRAFVAASDTVIEALMQFARTYTYTTALPPAVAAGCLKAMDLLQNDTWRRERLRDNIARFRDNLSAAGFRLPDSATPIQPVILNTPAAAIAASRALFERGFLVTAIRPPTVPEGTARLRVTLSAAHEPRQIDALTQALAEVAPAQDGQ